VKVLTIVGARPQFIKASAVSRVLRALNGADEVLVHTGQHFDDEMSAVFFDELGLQPPDHNLEVHGGGHGQMTGRMLERIESVLERECPDATIVYGDTNSTLAGAVAAAKLGVPVVHIEAGLRSFNRRMPEELNRVVTDHMSTLLCCPTANAARNLEREGFTNVIGGGTLVCQTPAVDADYAPCVSNVGDVMLDVLLHHRQTAAQSSTVLERLALAPRSYAVLTIHRADNTTSIDRLRELIEPVLRLARDLPVVFVVHPRTASRLKSTDDADMHERHSGMVMIKPLGYLDFLHLQANARVILTDSGGIQKEAFFLGVPCVTLRDETEWQETVDAGGNRLAGSRPRDLRDLVHARPSAADADLSPFGDGHAAERIVSLMRSLFGHTRG
jgi:UDP-GlcNAc3NAcA epimerase